MFKKFSKSLSLIGEPNLGTEEEEKEAKPVVTAASAAASMRSFMKKASSAATEMVKESTAKAVDLKNKAVQAADMDALQKKLGAALDTYAAGRLMFNVDNFG